MSAPATNSIEWPITDELRALIDGSVVAHVATLDRTGRPVAWPMTPYFDECGTAFQVSTGVTYPSKAERARRDPRTCLVIGGGDAPLVRVTALATVHDRDLQRNTDRFIHQRLAQFALAIACIITVKLIKWADRYNPTV